ncbi:MAG: MCE family protein, partial [Bacteroidota bacterium]
FSTLVWSARPGLKKGIVGLSELVQTFKKSADRLNTLLDENGGALDNSIKNVDSITTNFAQLSDSLNQAGLAQTLTEFQTTVTKLNTLLQKIENGEGSLGKFAHDERLYNNLAEASRELDLLLQDFRLNPKRYVNVSVFGKKQKDYELPEDDPANNQ